jgi:4-hydroxymandelate oxidase
LNDSGFRRGTDERVLEIVRTETRAAMQQCGARSVKELNSSFVRRAR